MPLALGIDAGGTSTTAVALEDGREVWRGSGLAANLSTQGLSSLHQTLEGCPPPSAVCAAFAGLVSEQQRLSAEEFLAEKFENATVRAAPDFEAALAACAPHANVCVIAGTGSIVCSRHEGEVKRTGGRGYVLGDEGSGFQFGRDALLEFLDASSESVSVGLAGAVHAALGTSSKGEAVAAVYSSSNIAKSLAALAPALAADAESGAIYALKSLRTNMAKLAHVCKQHVRRYGPAEPIIGCQGGLWNSSVYRRAFLEAIPLWVEIPIENVLFDLSEPVYGAAAIAEGLIGD